MEECKNKLDTFLIPKKYLTTKPSQFSYKLYINLCHYGFWNYFVDGRQNNRVEHYILDFGYKTLSNYFNTIGWKISRQKIQKEIENNSVYRIKDHEEFEEVLGKNLSWNSPVDNYSIFKLEPLSILRTEEEMNIRFYTLLQGWKYDTMVGVTQDEILKMIGYSTGGNNYTKLTKCIRRLKELKLIDYEKRSNGENNTYIIYYKNSK